MSVYSGWEAEVRLGPTGAEEKIGEARGVTVEVASGAERVYELGSRHAREIKRGNQEISGTIDKLWVGKDYLEKVKGDYPATDLSLVLKPGDGTVITVSGVVFESESLEIGAEDITGESVDFMATGITVA